MFYNQPLATRFGHELTAALNSEQWTQLDVAVAWIRASGMAHLAPSLGSFLDRGGILSTTVGVDLENTSSDGLRALLAVGAAKSATAFVHHNEGGTIFHPKLYLLRSSNSARLIIGSNNITEAGLFKNTEAALQLDLELGDPILASALNALDTWRDLATGLVHQLDESLIQALETNGYIKSEETLKAEHAARQAAAKSSTTMLLKLFKSIHISAPSVAGASAPSITTASAAVKKTTKSIANAPKSAKKAVPTTAPAAPAAARGQVLLMRVRKAHVSDRPTQTQIPVKVLSSAFFNGAMSVTSAHSGDAHPVSIAKARGSINTLKLEIPEMRDMADPVVRFDHTSAGIQYEVYDASSPQGSAVMTALRNGLAKGMANPTRLTFPSNPTRSTWWRFI